MAFLTVININFLALNWSCFIGSKTRCFVKTINVMTKIFPLSLFAVLVMSYACSDSDSSTQATIQPEIQTSSISAEELINSRCMICHKLTPTHDELLAPPMRGIQMNYRNKFSTKEEFVDAIVLWVNNPDSTNSHMSMAIDNFGVMPDLNYSDEEVRVIANYMYDADFPKPSWAGKGHGNGNMQIN